MTPIEIMAKAVRKILADSGCGQCNAIPMHVQYQLPNATILNVKRYTDLRITPVDVTVIARHRNDAYGRTTMVGIDTIAASDPEFVDRLIEAVEQAEREGDAMDSECA